MSVRLSMAARFTIELISGLTILSIAATAFAIHQKMITAPTPNAYLGSNSGTLAVPPPESPRYPVREIVGSEPHSTRMSQATKPGGEENVVESTDASASSFPGCDKPDAMGLSRIVEIDTTGGPEFGSQHRKGYDFLREKEVVLTFDDGPWPISTPAVLKALADQCLKATFFEIGEHARWHPEITREVIDAGMTIGTHTWSHKDLARRPFATEPAKAEQEIEMGNSAVKMAAGNSPIAPFFRFPDLQQSKQMIGYLAQRNVAVFSTDIDSRDFTMHKPDQVVNSVIDQLKKRGKGIVLMHDLHRNTAEALPELLRQLKDGGYKVVHIVPQEQLSTLPQYDEALSRGGLKYLARASGSWRNEKKH